MQTNEFYPVVFNDPIPWVWDSLLLLWILGLTCSVALITVAAVMRVKGKDIAGSIIVLKLISSVVLLVGLGLSLWLGADELSFIAGENVSSGSVPYMLSDILRYFAITMGISVIGVVGAMVLSLPRRGSNNDDP